MLYGKYKNVRNSAWQVLVDNEISELPVSVSKIAKNNGIKIVKNSSVNILEPDESGVSVIDGGHWYIIYDDTESKGRERFTIAHELGHIFLGHFLVTKKNYRRFIEWSETEQEADMFAARLLAPACVLWQAGIMTAESISRTCGISYTAARIRAARIDELSRRNKFFTDPLEVKVYTNFKNWIYLHNFT